MSAESRPIVVVFGESPEADERLVQVLTAAGATVTVTTDRESVGDADGVVLAPIGPFEKAMRELRELRGDELIERRLAGGRPVLAIGVGMHMLFDGLRVGDDLVDGLAQWPGEVSPLVTTADSYIGLGAVEGAGGSALFAGVETEKFDFTESSAAKQWTLDVFGAFTAPRVSFATMGERFVAAVENGPLTAVQFHPENSGEAGARLLRNWVQSL
jgi:glutamine amidotransferase